MRNFITLGVNASEGLTLSPTDIRFEFIAPIAIERRRELENSLEIWVLKRSHSPLDIARHRRTSLGTCMSLHDLIDHLFDKSANADNQVLCEVRLN